MQHATMMIISTSKILRFQGWKSLKQTCLVFLALGGLGSVALFAANAAAVPPASAKGEETYDQMFKRMQGKLIPLKDKEGNPNPEITLLLLLRPKSTNLFRTDLDIVRIPINRYPFTSKYPYVNSEKGFFPLLSLYDSKTIGSAAQYIGEELHWRRTAEAMRESVQVAAGIENMLSDTKFSVVALRPLDFYAKDGARIAVIFTKRTGNSPAPETFIYLLDPEKIGTMPEQPQAAQYAKGLNDPKFELEGKVCDLRMSEFLRRLHKEVESAVQDVSESSGSH